MTYTSQLIGRVGNQMFQYAALRAEAERDDVPFVTPSWEGDELFNLPRHEVVGEVRTLGGYRQDQASLIYTRSQVREWFKLRPEIVSQLVNVPSWEMLAHRRVGDYPDLGYPVVSVESYHAACEKFGYDWKSLRFVSEDDPLLVIGLPEWLPDFYRMMRAKVLFRANSSFSWWSSALSNAEVYSPVVDGLGAGAHDVEFVRGNWPRFCSLPGITDLHLL